MSQDEIKRQWLKYTQLAILFQQKADTYRASVTTRIVGILPSDRLAQLAERKAAELWWLLNLNTIQS